MAAKLLHSLTDDNPDLQKQIGCMTGIFQMFDRQQMLTGGRRIVGQTPKRLSTGNSHFTSSTQPRSSSLEKHSHKNNNTQDRQQRISTESSRASFTSSSRSSSFSSLDCNRATQLEPAIFDRMIFPETPSRDPSMGPPQNSSSFQSSRQNADLRDFVKDSIYREVHSLSSSKAKTTEGDDDDKKKQYTPADIKESLRILAKLQEEEPKHHHEPIRLSRSSSYHSKDGSSFSTSKEAPRFSYDGREINRTWFNGPNSALGLKDLPRLSLDSREGSMRNLTADSKSNSFLKSMKRDSGGRMFDGSNIQSNRPPSVVAKLMGLEALPQSISSSDTNVGFSRSYLEEEDLVNSFGKTSQIKPIQQPSSPNSSWKEPISPRWRNSEMKPMPRFPNEPAPWKQIDESRTSQKAAASRSTRGSAKAPSTFPSVYSEIEKRLKDLEFTQSGKDLRALKQILEAMQAKGLLETTPKEGEGSNFTNNKEHQQKSLGSYRKPENDRNHDFLKKRNVSSQKYESPIVIMKPAKLVGKSGIPAAASVIPLDGLTNLPKIRGGDNNRKGISSGRSSKDLTVKANQRDNNALTSVNMESDRTLKTTETSTRSKSSGSISPRMQQKKMELEKRSRPPTPPDSSRSRRQSNVKQQAESNSPGGRRRAKQVSSQQSDDQLSEVSVESRNLSSLENEDSAQLNEIADMMTSSERSPSLKSSEFMLSGLVEKKPNLMLSEEESGEVSAEYSSPVSVLDNAVYKHDSPSPVKYVGKTLKVDSSLANERDVNPVQQSSSDNLIPNSMESFSTFDISRKKLQNIENLVQKLRRLNSSHDEARTDYIASLCENSNPDHRYISEILLASGLLLRDLSSTLSDFQFHPSGNPINPELFLVLEQTKASSTSSKEGCGVHKINQTTAKSEKFHRKLVFDAVNEILARKLAFAGLHLEPWLRPRRIAVKGLNAQKLLRELCSEIQELQSKNSKWRSVEEDDDDDGWKKILHEDVMHGSERWIDFDGEISGAILDIERSIFKDLVDEIVLGESAARAMKKVGRRKLFAK